MDNVSANNNSKTPKLSALIKKTWDKLTNEEIGFHESNPDHFFDAIKTKYSIDKDEVEKTMKKLDAECAQACSTSAGKNAETGSVSLPKAANS